MDLYHYLNLLIIINLYPLIVELINLIQFKFLDYYLHLLEHH